MPFYGAYVDLGFLLSVLQQRLGYGTVGLLYFSARSIYIMELGVPGCYEGILEDRKRAQLSRGKGLVVRFEGWQNNERGGFLA